MHVLPNDKRQMAAVSSVVVGVRFSDWGVRVGLVLIFLFTPL